MGDMSCGTGLFTRRLAKAKHPDTRVEEIRRVLKPGAPFFATTFLVGAMGTDSLPKAVRDRGYRFFTVDELEGLFTAAGFVDVVVRKEAPARAVITCAAPGASSV